ncbi:MAG TPA: peptidoglycan DD-metalloendopeptidase family protein [Burkholderiaceae bacterium]
MRLGCVSGVLAALALFAGCSTTHNRAPVEDRNAGGRAPVATNGVASAEAVPAPAEATKPLPGAENAGKPGYYTVKPGDRLIRIGLENGQSWKDLAKWNNIENPDRIEVGQTLRVVPPDVDPSAASSKPVTTAKVETKPLDAKPAVGAVSGASAAPAPSAPPTVSTTSPTPAPRDGDDDINWGWPASGPVVGNFEEGKVKGLAIGGKAGDPVLAAADGRVVYAGAGLRGYGNLVIIKHNNTYLTAYAHNQTLLVKDDQAVRKGQKIAEMGSTDADSVRLHFEIRRQGKPIDPAKLLPPR